MWPLSWRGCAVLLLFTLAACARDEPASPPAPLARAAAPAAKAHPPQAQPPRMVDAAADDDASLVLPDLMDLQVDPAAAVLLAAADPQGAWQTDAASPPSHQAWQAVDEAAAQLQRSGQLLADPALAHGRADWLQWTANLRQAADAGSRAARRHDQQRLAEAAGQVQAACQGCHARYAGQLVQGLAVSRITAQWQR